MGKSRLGFSGFTLTFFLSRLNQYRLARFLAFFEEGDLLEGHWSVGAVVI